MIALLPLLIQFVPEIAHWIAGDETSPTAQAVASVAAGVLGTVDPTAAAAALQDPQKVADLRLALGKISADSAAAQLTTAVQLGAQQADVNKIEATSGSLFVAGWRPAIGWVCAAGVAYAYVGYPILLDLVAIWRGQEPPAPDTSTLLTLLLTMMGVAGLRTYEKVQGVGGKFILPASALSPLVRGITGR